MIKKLLLGTTLLFFTFSLASIFNSKETTTVLGTMSSQQKTSDSIQSKTITMGAVTLEIIPEQIEQDKEIIFQVNLNTHSVDLDYDFTNVFKLSDDKNSEYKPLKWTGERGGHHLSGKIFFDQLHSQSKSVILDIEGINDLSEQVVFSLE